MIVMKKATVMKFRTPYNYVCVKRDIETVKGVSLTVPGESYTIPELFDRFRSGMPLNVEREVYYDENADFDTDVRIHAPDLDLSDLDVIKGDVDRVLEKKKFIEKTKESKRLKKEVTKVTKREEEEKTEPIEGQ